MGLSRGRSLPRSFVGNEEGRWDSVEKVFDRAIGVVEAGSKSGNDLKLQHGVVMHTADRPI